MECRTARAHIPPKSRESRKVDLYWDLHLALAMAHHTIRESERLIRLSDGKCDLNGVQGIIDRIVAVSALALRGREAETKPPAKLVARDARG